MLRSLVSQEKGTFPSQRGKISHLSLVFNLTRFCSFISLKETILLEIFVVLSPRWYREHRWSKTVVGFKNYLLFFGSQEKLGDVFICVQGNAALGC